jgi:hypothetical protein
MKKSVKYDMEVHRYILLPCVLHVAYNSCHSCHHHFIAVIKGYKPFLVVVADFEIEGFAYRNKTRY